MGFKRHRASASGGRRLTLRRCGEDAQSEGLPKRVLDLLRADFICPGENRQQVTGLRGDHL